MRSKPVLFELAQYLDAGLDPASAVARTCADKPADRRALDRLRTALRHGQSLAAALATTGYAGKLDAAIIGVGEHAGKLTAALRAVAERAERRDSRVAALRARLWLPNCVLAIVIGSNIVRALSAGTALSTALLDAAIVALPILGVAYAITAALACDAVAWLRLAWTTKLIDSSALVREYFEHTFFTLLAWQANAGVDFVAGATNLGTLIDDPRYRKRVQRYRAALRRGDSVTTALANAGLLHGKELTQVLGTAEHAGRIASALEHYLAARGEQLERTTDAAFAWLPRVYYAAVFVIGGASLL